MPFGMEVGLQPRRVCVTLGFGTQPPPEKWGGVPSLILSVEVENFEIGPEVRGTSGYS